MNSRRSRRRGIVLLLALLVLTILIILVGQIVLATAHGRSVADNALGDLQNSYGTKSAWAVAVQYLLADAEKAPDVDTTEEKWAGPIALAVGTASVTVKIEDCERKLNLAMMVNDKGEENPGFVAQVRRLLRNLGHEDEIADRILDYQDADSKGDFESGARNERLWSLDELQRIDGIKREVLVGDENHKGILAFLTVFPRTQTPPGGGATFVGLVNLNTAAAEVFEALSDDMTPSIAAAIVARRTEKNAEGSSNSFTTTNQLKDVDGMTDKLYQQLAPQCVVRASAFEIHAKSVVGAVEKKWVYVVSRTIPPPSQSGPSVPKVSLIATQRENEILSVQPGAEKK